MYNEYVTENFNILDLLTHRSGLGLGAGDLMFVPDGSDFTIKDVLTSFQYFKPVSAFRTKYDYDNLLYIVAGEVITRVSGMSYESFVQKRILAPLKMDHTFFNDAFRGDKNNMATPHSSVSGKLKTITVFEEPTTNAAGGIISSVVDMSKWITMHLNKGNYHENLKTALFSLKNHNEMWRIHTVRETDPNPRYNSHFKGYGLGWHLTDIKGTLKVSHSGAVPGMISEVTLLPDLKLGVVILTNTENGGGPICYAITQSIVDSYLGLDDFRWIDKIVEWEKQSGKKDDTVTRQAWKKVESQKSIGIKNDNFVGVYEDKWFGKVEVYEKGQGLWFRSYRSPKLNGPLAFYDTNIFAVKWEYQDMNCDAFAIFSCDEAGKAQSIRMKGISPDIDFSFDFQDLDLKRIGR